MCKVVGSQNPVSALSKRWAHRIVATFLTLSFAIIGGAECFLSGMVLEAKAAPVTVKALDLGRSNNARSSRKTPERKKRQKKNGRVNKSRRKKNQGPTKQLISIPARPTSDSSTEESNTESQNLIAELTPSVERVPSSVFYYLELIKVKLSDESLCLFFVDRSQSYFACHNFINKTTTSELISAASLPPFFNYLDESGFTTLPISDRLRRSLESGDTEALALALLAISGVGEPTHTEPYAAAGKLEKSTTLTFRQREITSEYAKPLREPILRAIRELLARFADSVQRNPETDYLRKINVDVSLPKPTNSLVSDLNNALKNTSAPGSEIDSLLAEIRKEIKTTIAQFNLSEDGDLLIVLNDGSMYKISDPQMLHIAEQRIPSKMESSTDTSPSPRLPDQAKVVPTYAPSLFDHFVPLGHYPGGLSNGVDYGQLADGTRVVVKGLSFFTPDAAKSYLVGLESLKELADKARFAKILDTRVTELPQGGMWRVDVMMEDLKYTSSGKRAWSATAEFPRAALPDGLQISTEQRMALADRLLLTIALHGDPNVGNTMLRGKYVMKPSGVPAYYVEVKLIDPEGAMPEPGSVFDTFLRGEAPRMFGTGRGSEVYRYIHQLQLPANYTHPFTRMTREAWLDLQAQSWDPLSFPLDTRLRSSIEP